MPTELNREDVRRRVARGGQLVEVLPAKDHAAEHLPGAISLPLETLDAASAERLRRDRPVVVYCFDYQ
jgi:rhodanese-related sulfurtransferase